MVIEVPIYGGPMDGGYVTVGTEPDHLAVIYTPTQPSDRHWWAGKSVGDEHLKCEWSAQPFARRQAKYAYSARAQKFLYDGTHKEANR